MSLIKEQSGYTIIELMLVLALISSMFVYLGASAYHTMDRAEYEKFRKQFEQDLIYLQQLNELRDGQFHLSFDQDHHQYLIRRAGIGEIVMKRSYPQNWTMEANTMKFPLSFSNDGTLKNPGTFKIITATESYFITCPFGKGRCYSEKAE